MSEVREKASAAMKVAWEIYREDQRQGTPRAFGECLKASWKLLRKLRQAARALPPPADAVYRKRKSPSPFQQAGPSKALARFKAAYLTAKIGR